MTQQNREVPNQPENRSLTPMGSMALGSVEVKEPVAPRGMTEEEKRGLEERTLALVEQLEDATGGEQLQLADSISNVGLKAQRTAGRELNLLRGRVGEMLSKEGPGGQIAQDLVRLRTALNEINPSAFDRGFFGRMIAALPFVGDHVLKVLETVAIRYEAVCRQVEILEESLRNGLAMLKQDNAELAVLYSSNMFRRDPNVVSWMEIGSCTHGTILTGSTSHIYTKLLLALPMHWTHLLPRRNSTNSRL